MTGAQLLIRCLEHEGVRYVFGVPGEETLDLNDALLDSPIRFIPVRHEQAAAFMADVWGRLTGRAGVCLATLGPGATNLTTGLADANLDRAPVVAITGQLARGLLHKESHQYVDIVEAFRPFTKWNAQIETGEVIPEVVRKAFKVAQEEKPGVCHLELPEDVAGEPAEGEPLRVYQPRRPSPDRPSLARAADIVNRADRPLILAGNGVIRGHAARELRVLAERAQIPVVTTFMAKGALPADHPAHGHAPSASSRRTSSAPGSRRRTSSWPSATTRWSTRRPAGTRRGTRGSSTSTSRPPRWTRATSRTSRSSPTCARRWSSWRRSWPCAPSARPPAPRAPDPRRRADAFPLLPQRIMADLEAVLAPEDLVISDVGAHKLWVAKAYGARLPNTVIISNGFAAMGIGLPGAIAAKLAEPGRRVVTVTGDGGFLMNAQELETARRLGLGFVVLVLRDDGYGVIRWKQQKRFGRTAGVDLGNPDLVALAEAFGCRGIRVESAAGLRPALDAALASPVPALVDCPVDYAENDRLAEL